jgi:hypothetical protein
MQAYLYLFSQNEGMPLPSTFNATRWFAYEGATQSPAALREVSWFGVLDPHPRDLGFPTISAPCGDALVRARANGDSACNLL